MNGGADWVSIVLTWGPGGVFASLLLSGILEPKRVRVGLEKDRDDWRGAYETERAAHVVTREALSAANARGEVALTSAQSLTRMLEALGHPPASGR